MVEPVPARLLHPLEQVEIDLELKLTGEKARRVMEIAERLRMEPAEMLADIIHYAIDDDLVVVEAIIDP